MLVTRCPWYITDPLLGLLIVGIRAALNKPFGALGGYIELIEKAARPRTLGVPAFVVLGIVLGGAAFALLTGAMSWTFDYAGVAAGRTTFAQFPLLLVAGVAMGFGARMAGGCTSGHGLCGMSLASPASIVSTITFFATAVALAQVFVRLLGGL